MPYLPSKLPAMDADKEPDANALADYLENELQRLASSLLEDVRVLELGASTTAPIRPRTGIIAYADGTNWNPGSGEGTYVYGSDGAWHLLNTPAGVSSIAGNTGAFTLGPGLKNKVNVLQVDGDLGIRNRIINPSGQIVQVAVGSQTDVTYDFDQWLSLSQTAAITASQVTNAENSTPFMMRSSQAQAAAQRFGRIQWLESGNCLDLRGQQITLSARVRMSASTTLRYAIVEWTGTADSITKDVVLDWTNATFTTGQFFTSTSTVITATGSIALTANTLASISLSGTVGSSMNNLAVVFWTDSTQAQNVTLDVGKVQLEIGAQATPLAFRPPQQELALCQRYFYSMPAASYGYPSPNSGGFAAFQRYDFKVTMRTTPSVSTSYTSQSNISLINANTRTPDFMSDQIVSTTSTNTSWVFSATANARL